jgi:VanZ family protein
VWTGLILLMLGLTYDALTPRPDWYDAPFVLWPPQFRFVVGRFGTDKIEHVAAAFGLMLAVAFALDAFRPSAGAVRRAGVCIQLWCMAIEIIQGFLPYRNFELMDVLANLTGGLVGFVVLHAHRRFWPRTVERDALDNRAPLSKTPRHVEAGPGRGVERSRN